MLQQVMKSGSILLLSSACISAMEQPISEQITTTLATPHARYYIKVLDFLPSKLGISFAQHLIANTPKSALPIALLSYKLHQQRKLQVQHYQLRLLLANNEQVELTPKLSSELVQASATIQNFIQDIGIQDNAVQAEEIPLLLLTQEQVTALLSYISSINALNTSDSILPMLQQEIPETAGLSSYWINYTAIQQLKKHLTAQTIPALCNLIIAASYLNIQNNEQTVNLIELATQALANKLLQVPQYQAEYDVINTLPPHVQRMLVQYFIDNNIIRYTLCGNSSETIANTVQTLTDHTSWVNTSSWSPDGKQIASCHSGKTIRVWDATTGDCIHTLTDPTGYITSISWSPNGKYISSGSWGNIIKVWDITTDTCMHTLTGNPYSPLTGFVWSPDGKQIASGSGDKTVRVWDATTGACIHTLTGHTKTIISFDWSFDGSMIASSSYDETVKIWKVANSTCIHTLTNPTGSINIPRWSPDGKYIVSGSNDNTIRIWDTNTGTCVQTLTGHTSQIKSVSWSPDGNYIASCSADKTIKIWNATTCDCIYTLTEDVYSVLWSPDGSKLASSSGDATVKLWSIVNKELDDYLKTTLTWKQALLLVRIVSAYNNGHYPVDFVQDRKAFQCYNSLDQQVKQLVEPLLSEQTRIATQTVKNLDRLTRANPVRTALFGVGLEVSRKHYLRK